MVAGSSSLFICNSFHYIKKFSEMVRPSSKNKVVLWSALKTIAYDEQRAFCDHFSNLTFPLLSNLAWHEFLKPLLCEWVDFSMSQLFLIFGSHASLVDFLVGYYCFQGKFCFYNTLFPGENEKTFLTAG